jgi:hypothetical protein
MSPVQSAVLGCILRQGVLLDSISAIYIEITLVFRIKYVTNSVCSVEVVTPH